jgi:hypothetical protein
MQVLVKYCDSVRRSTRRQKELEEAAQAAAASGAPAAAPLDGAAILVSAAAAGHSSKLRQRQKAVLQDTQGTARAAMRQRCSGATHGLTRFAHALAWQILCVLFVMFRSVSNAAWHCRRSPLTRVPLCLLSTRKACICWSSCVRPMPIASTRRRKISWSRCQLQLRVGMPLLLAPSVPLVRRSSRHARARMCSAHSWPPSC